jgi:hypothetical protein
MDTSDTTQGLAWWENLLIVLGALVGFGLIAWAVDYGLGLPGNRRRAEVKESLIVNDI